MSYDGYVRLSLIPAGYPGEGDRARLRLKSNVFYEIKSIDIYSSSTTVTLKDIEEDFNSVLFNYYNKDKLLLEDGIMSKELSHLTHHNYFRG